MDIHERQFEMKSSISTYWHNKSADLHSSATVLWEAMKDEDSLQISCYSTYKMLMGMSLEALIKAHCIAQNIDDDKVKKSHRLTELSSLAGINFSKEDNKILDVLTEYVIWDGKYPAPKKSSQLKNHYQNVQATEYDIEKLGTLDIYHSNGALDFSNLHRIWRKLSDQYMDRYN